MDNFTHSLAGWALGQAGLKTKTRKGLAALILGANMPDIDVFLGWVPWEPLATHRGFTHGLVGGVLVMPPMLAGLLLLLDRWQVRRGATFKSGLAMHLGWLLALCYLGALTHPLLDLQTTYSVQLFSPLRQRWYPCRQPVHHRRLAVDLLAGSIAWSRWREKRGREWRRPVQGAIAVALVYIAFNLGLSQTATETRPARASRRPRPSSPRRRRSGSGSRSMSWREGRSIGRAEFEPFGRRPARRSSRCRPDGMDDPMVRAAIARRDPALRNSSAGRSCRSRRVDRGRCKANDHHRRRALRRPGSRKSRLAREIDRAACGPGC